MLKRCLNCCGARVILLVNPFTLIVSASCLLLLQMWLSLAKTETVEAVEGSQESTLPQWTQITVW